MIAGSGLFTGFCAEGTGGGSAAQGGNNKGGGEEPIALQCPLEQPCAPGTDSTGNRATKITKDHRCLLVRQGEAPLCERLEKAAAPRKEASSGSGPGPR